MGNIAVTSLLKIGFKDYDDDLVRDILEPRDVKLCLQIHIPNAASLDEWYWRFDIRVDIHLRVLIGYSLVILMICMSLPFYCTGLLCGV